MSSGFIAQAREAVARYFTDLDRPDLSRLVLDGDGDDFPEMQMAASLLGTQSQRIARYEDALGQYADPGFWDEGTPGGPLALHDIGEMARNVLAGKSAFFHRD
jgi:hypothetical protein